MLPRFSCIPHRSEKLKYASTTHLRSSPFCGPSLRGVGPAICDSAESDLVPVLRFSIRHSWIWRRFCDCNSAAFAFVGFGAGSAIAIRRLLHLLDFGAGPAICDLRVLGIGAGPAICNSTYVRLSVC
jgi:hypothetical protein